MAGNGYTSAGVPLPLLLSFVVQSVIVMAPVPPPATSDGIKLCALFLPVPFAKLGCGMHRENAIAYPRRAQEEAAVQNRQRRHSRESGNP